jgi:N-methylhydantoinase A
VRDELPKTARVQVTAHVRYRGQGAALVLPLNQRLPSTFAAEHGRLFGFVADAPLELVRITARGASSPRSLPSSPLPKRTAPPRQRRRAPLGGSTWPVYERAEVLDLSGPAIVEEGTGTTLVPAGWRGRATPFGMVLEG